MNDVKKSIPKDKKPLSVYDIIFETGIVVIGAVLFGMSVNMFLLPGDIIMGGVTGISTTLNILFGFRIGIVMIILNVPLLIANTYVYGIKFFTKTIIGILATSIAVEILTFFPVTIDDPLLCALFGGAVMGTGTGLLFTRGYTTGGSDLVGWLLKSRFKNISTGRLILLVDIVIVVGSAIALRNFKGIIYSMVSIYTFTFVIDLVLSGADRAKLAMIFSEKYKDIAHEITNRIGRGVTILYGSGWYTQEDKHIIMCVVKKSELFRTKSIIHSIDPAAFIIFTDATEVMGYGFKSGGGNAVN
jgi:uncharacterized membrane-anchored protein YitT (DUF2179 family)